MTISNSLTAFTVTCLAILAGCATNTRELLSRDSPTMIDIWSGHASGEATSASSDHDPGLVSRYSRGECDSPGISISPETYTRTAETELQILFQRLPNPDLVMFVFPHLSGTEQVPIPGYSTVFPLFRNVHYALPGERTRDY